MTRWAGRGIERAAVTSAALAWLVQVDFQCGRGLDENALSRAMTLYDSTFDVPIIFRAPFVHALTLSWTGHLEQAHREFIGSAQTLCRARARRAT